MIVPSVNLQDAFHVCLIRVGELKSVSHALLHLQMLLRVNGSKFISYYESWNDYCKPLATRLTK